MPKESVFQAELIRDLYDEFPGIIVLKNDPNYLQGFPDLTLLYFDTWAVLETKQQKGSRRRPNQEYYIETLGKMAYASFISPENKERVFYELSEAFRSRRSSRLPFRK